MHVPRGLTRLLERWLGRLFCTLVISTAALLWLIFILTFALRTYHYVRLFLHP